MDVPNINFIETSTEWLYRRDLMAQRMFAKWQALRQMAGLTRNIEHNWTQVEETRLVQCLVQLVHDEGWRSDNRTFRNKYHNELLRMMREKNPGCLVTSTTMIDSMVKTLKKQYQAIVEMLGNGSSEFRWNDALKCIEVESTIFDTWVQTHPNAKGLNNKPFPHYDDLAFVFGKDTASGSIAESARQMVEDDLNGLDDEGGCSQSYHRLELPISEEDDLHTLTSRISRPSTSSQGGKRKRGSYHQKMVDMVRTFMGMQYALMDRIAAWPETIQRVANEDSRSKREKVIQSLLNLSPPFSCQERVVLMHILLKDLGEASSFLAVPLEDKRGYCQYLLSKHG